MHVCVSFRQFVNPPGPSTEVLLTNTSCVLCLSSSLGSVLESYDLKDKGFHIQDFLQVDKQGLVMDVLGALQAHTNRFSVDDPEASKADDNLGAVATTASLTIQSDSTNEEHGANSGNVRILTGEATNSGQSGDITIASGRADEVSFYIDSSPSL